MVSEVAVVFPERSGDSIGHSDQRWTLDVLSDVWMEAGGDYRGIDETGNAHLAFSK